MALLVLTAWATCSAPSAGAAAPTLQGWWTASNPVITPDVPPQGLLVQGGADAVTSYAALLYRVADSTAGSNLVLKVAAGSATTAGSTLQVCALKSSDFRAEQGGRLSDGPGYDCARKTTSAPSADGTGYQFDVGPFIADGTLGVAIVGTQATDRVVFDGPGETSLREQPSVPSRESSTEAAEFGTGPAELSPGGSEQLVLDEPVPAATDPLDSSETSSEGAPGPTAGARREALAATPAPSVELAPGNGPGKGKPVAIGLVIFIVAVAGGSWATAAGVAGRTPLHDQRPR